MNRYEINEVPEEFSDVPLRDYRRLIKLTDEYLNFIQLWGCCLSPIMVILIYLPPLKDKLENIQYLAKLPPTMGKADIFKLLTSGILIQSSEETQKGVLKKVEDGYQKGIEAQKSPSTPLVDAGNKSIHRFTRLVAIMAFKKRTPKG